CEPDHWFDGLDIDVSENCPVNTFLKAIDMPDISETPEAKEISADLLQVMKDTLDYLSSKYKVFDKSYLLPVGSNAENTKIKKADEFDFAVILPCLAEKDVYSLLLRKESVYSDPDIKMLAHDISDDDPKEVILNFQSYLKLLWSSAMSSYMEPDWEILDTGCYQDDVSIAGTFHVQRKRDNTQVDLDVCFWIPLDAEKLLAAPDELRQRDYLLANSLDDKGLVYAILPRDGNISISLNSVRFAMSRLEKQALHRYGPGNGRLNCYRLCKCVVSSLVPKFKKRENCHLCYESLISSFCLKNVVLYMAANHKKDEFWTDKQLPNRVAEVFSILSFCMKANACEISAFFSPYEMRIASFSQFDPETRCIVDRCHEFVFEKESACLLPDIQPILDKMNDTAARKILTDYDKFLSSTEWQFPEVICRLSEVLCGLREEDPSERQNLAREPGWNTYGLNLPKSESYFVQSVDTKL
ncbi:MAG: hypothetical protein AB2693_25500, partial [Candidatus Thiodiazotropha sp.]